MRMNNKSLICVSYPAGSGGSFILSMIVSSVLDDNYIFKFDNIANCHPYKINYLRTYIPENFSVVLGNYEALQSVPMNPVVIYCQNIMPYYHVENFFKTTKIVAIDFDTEDDLHWMLTNHFFKAEIDFDINKQHSLDIWTVYKKLAFVGKVETRQAETLADIPLHDLGIVLAEYTRRYYRNLGNFGPGWKFNWNVLNGHDQKNIHLIKFRDIMTNPKLVLSQLSELIGPPSKTSITNYINYLEAQIKFIEAKAEWLRPNCDQIKAGLLELYMVQGNINDKA